MKRSRGGGVRFSVPLPHRSPPPSPDVPDADATAAERFGDSQEGAEVAEHKVVEVRATGRLPEVVAQDVQSVVPRAVFAGRDGYLRVNYQKLGLTFETYDAWIRSGAKIPPTVRIEP